MDDGMSHIIPVKSPFGHSNLTLIWILDHGMSLSSFLNGPHLGSLWAMNYCSNSQSVSSSASYYTLRFARRRVENSRVSSSIDIPKNSLSAF